MSEIVVMLKWKNLCLLVLFFCGGEGITAYICLVSLNNPYLEALTSICMNVALFKNKRLLCREIT